MAALGILSSTETLPTTPEVVKVLWGKTGEDLVNKTESLPRSEVQPAQSCGGRDNESTHGKSEPANGQKDTDVFSFRNYILGISSNVKTPEAKCEMKTTRSLEEHSEIKKEKKTELDMQGKTSHLSESERKHFCHETQTETVATNEKHGDYNMAIEENNTQACKEVTVLEVIDAAETKKEGVDETRSGICEDVKDGDSGHATQEGSNLQGKEAGALSEIQTGANTQSEFNKRPKKGKRKPRKKKKTVVQAKEEFQPLSPLTVETHVDSVTNAQSVSQQVPPAVTCEQQPDNVINCKQQLSPGEKPSPRPSLTSPSGGTDQITYLDCSPASRRAPLQSPPPSDDHSHTNASSSANHCTEENAQHERNGNTDIICSQNIPSTCVQTAVVCPAASPDQKSDAQAQDVVTLGAVTPPEEDQRLPLDSQVCVGEDGVESALDEAGVVVATLPLTTPTMQELIESKGETESVRHDSLERVAAVAFIESEKAVGEECLGGKDKGISDASREEDGLLDSHSALSLIPSQESSSLAFSATGQHTSEESCSSKMPHNVVKAEAKGQKNICYTHTEAEVSSTGGQAREKEAFFLETFISTSPSGLLTGLDCLDHSVVSVEAAEEGGEEDMKHKGGLASEHIIFSQPEGSVGGVSSAETETCPPTDVAESLLKPQSSSEQISAITKSPCTEKDQSSQCWQEQQNAADLPPSTPSERSSSNANGEVRAEGTLTEISEEAQSSVDGACEESSVTQEEKTHIQVFQQTQTTSQRTSIEQESSNIQQVAPERGSFDSGTVEAACNFQAQVDKGKQAMSSVGLHVCDDSGRKNKMHFEDLKNLSVLATDFDSLPPLTVRERLQHPVVETSYIFQDFLNNNKAEISTSPADGKDKLPELKKSDVQLNTAELEMKDHHINLNVDNSNLKTNTLELKSMDETHLKLLLCSNEKNKNDEKYLAVLPNAICETDHLKVKQLPEDVVSLSAAGEKELVESELPLNLSAEGDVPFDLEKRGSNHNLSICPVLPADECCRNLNDVFSEVPDVQLTELVTRADVEAVPSIDSPQSSAQLDRPPLSGPDPSDPSKATLEDDVYLQEDKPCSEVTTDNQLISPTEQSASFVLKPFGPMLNHLEVIADCNCSPEITDAFQADSGVMEVSGKASRELAMMSVTQNNIENRNDSVEPDILANKCMISDLNAASLSPGMAKMGSVVAVSQSPSEPDSTRKVLCEAAMKDDLTNISCSLSSGLPHDELQQDRVKERSTTEDQTYDENRQDQWTTDNQQETDKNRLEIGKAPQQTRGQDNDAFEEVSGHNAESLLGDVKEEGKKYNSASESLRQTSLVSSDNHPETPENSTEVQSSPGFPTANDKSLCQNLKEALQCSSERDATQSDAVLAQSQSNCLDPQQAIFPGINMVAEKGKSFVGNLCLSGSQTEAVIDAGIGEDGSKAVPGVGQVCLAPLASMLDNIVEVEKNAIDNVGRELDSFYASDGKLDENKFSMLSADTEVLSKFGCKGQEETTLPAVCHKLQETTMNNDVAVAPAPEEHEPWPLPVSCTSEVSRGGDDIYTGGPKSGNEADGIHRETVSPHPEPETVEKDSTAVKSNGRETEECEIQHTVGECLEPHSSTVTSATQNDMGAPVKCSAEKRTSNTQQSDGNKIGEIKKEGMGANVVVNLQTENAGDSGTGSVQVSHFTVGGGAQHGSETTVCDTQESLCAFKAIEHHDSLEYRTPDVVTVSPKTTDSASPAAVPTQSEKICVTFLSKPEDTDVVVPVDATAEDSSLRRGLPCTSPVERNTVNEETEDVSGTLGAELRAQDQSTVWTEAVKEAASYCQSKQQNTMIISR